MKKRASDLIDAINALRVAAGLPIKKYAGTSMMTLQVILNKAQRSDF